MFFFSGFGFLVPVIYFACAIGYQIATDTVFGDGHYTDNLMPKIYAALISAFFIYRFGVYLHKRSYPNGDEDFEPLAPHSFFFIPVRFWGHIIFGICVLTVAISLFT